MRTISHLMLMEMKRRKMKGKKVNINLLRRQRLMY